MVNVERFRSWNVIKLRHKNDNNDRKSNIILYFLWTLEVTSLRPVQPVTPWKSYLLQGIATCIYITSWLSVRPQRKKTQAFWLLYHFKINFHQKRTKDRLASVCSPKRFLHWEFIHRLYRYEPGSDLYISSSLICTIIAFNGWALKPKQLRLPM